MTPKGADLEATDLIEVSTIESGSYVTRSITGQELIDAIPLPPSGLTVGTTPISSGTNGRVLFQGTGNVLQQSGNLFWDSTNNRLGIGTSTPDTGLTIVSGNTFDAIKFKGASSSVSGYLATGGTSAFFSSGADATGSYVQVSSTEAIVNGASRLALYTAGTEKARIFSTGNIGINTTTDAGFRLDVNGTARVSGNTTINAALTVAVSNLPVFNLLDTLINHTWQLRSNGGSLWFIANGANNVQFRTNGNVLIGTTTDAGYKLDVNGTARVVNQLTVQGMTVGLGGGAVVSNTVVGNVAFNSNTSGQNNTAIGESALFSNTTGTANVAVGRRALFASNSAQNVALGNDSLRFNTAANNTAVGYFSLYNNTTGASNTSIGHNAGNTTTTGSGNVFIGKDAVALNATDSNQFVVGSSTTNAGSVTSEVNTSTQVWNVVINGVARKILLA